MKKSVTNINKLRKNFFYREYKLNYLIKKYKKPIISFVNGICMGGGVGIAMHSSIVVVSENVKFAMPECYNWTFSRCWFCPTFYPN